MDMTQMSSINGMQSLQSIQNNSGVTGTTGDFFGQFIQSLLLSFEGTNEEKNNLIAGLQGFNVENPEENEELMSMIASMMAVGVNYDDIVKNGTFDPSSYINSALTSTNDLNLYANSGFDAQTLSSLQSLATNNNTDMSAMMEIANSHNYSDGQLMLELAMNSANLNTLNSGDIYGSSNTSNNSFDLMSLMGTSTTDTDLATQLYSANTSMNTAIAQAMADVNNTASQTTANIASIPEEPTEDPLIDQLGGFQQHLPVSVETTEKAEVVQQTAFTQELDVEDLNNQIATGIRNGDITDTKEMVIRLRPEGLGEVTVKLVQDNSNNIKIDIVTASERTAQLLNDKLPTLRENMRELQAEISDVLFNDNQGNPEQNAKDQAEMWAYNQEQREQRDAINLDELDDLLGDDYDDLTDESQNLGTSKIYI